MSLHIPVLLIDDLRDFRPRVLTDATAVTTIRTSPEAVAFFQQHNDATFGQVWLDHDLGDVTGVKDSAGPVVDWLCDHARNGHAGTVDRIFVHTSNGVAAQRMTVTLTRAGYRVTRVAAADYLAVNPTLHARVVDLPGTMRPTGGGNEGGVTAVMRRNGRFDV